MPISRATPRLEAKPFPKRPELAILHPGEAPASSLSEFVEAITKELCPLVTPNTTKYLVDALSVVVLAGVKLWFPADATLPIRSTTFSPGRFEELLL